MKKIILLALLLISEKAWAGDYKFTIAKIDPGVLHKQIIAAGITHNGINCVGTENAKCVVLNPSASPAAVIEAYVYSDPDAIRKDLVDELAGIKEKLDTADIDDLRRAIKIILQLTGL